MHLTLDQRVWDGHQARMSNNRTPDGIYMNGHTPLGVIRQGLATNSSENFLIAGPPQFMNEGPRFQEFQFPGKIESQSMMPKVMVQRPSISRSIIDQHNIN